MSAADNEVDCSRAATKIWLVKVPRWLAERWEDSQLDGQEVAKLQLTQLPGEQPDCQIVLPDTPQNQGMPKHLQLKIQNTEVLNTFTFSEGSDGRAAAIEGTVYHEAAIMPALSDEFKRLSKTRALKAAKPTRMVKLVDQTTVNRAQALTGTSKKGDIYSRSFGKPKNDPDNRRERMDKAELIDLLLTLFAEYPYWKMKGLLDRTKQPHAHLRATLDSVAKLNKNGPYNGMYNLKPEFAERVGETAAARRKAAAAAAVAATAAGSSSLDDGTRPSDDDHFQQDNEDQDDDDDDGGYGYDDEDPDMMFE
ncbi:hypothetical protein RI367_005574 [Sorochytrium milnesiophthora]